MKIILGTAHGINTPGKRSPDEVLREYQWSRDMCLMIQEKLVNMGIDCVIDIIEPHEKSLTSRIKIVNNIVNESDDDCIYVSVHINAAKSDGTWSNASGWTVWIYDNASQNSKDLALALFNTALSENIFGNRYIPESKYFTGNFAVLRDTICPSILTENMFQDNKQDVEFLMSDKGKQILCDVHVNGILSYIKSKEG